MIILVITIDIIIIIKPMKSAGTRKQPQALVEFTPFKIPPHPPTRLCDLQGIKSSPDRPWGVVDGRRQSRSCEAKKTASIQSPRNPISPCFFVGHPSSWFLIPRSALPLDLGSMRHLFSSILLGSGIRAMVLKDESGFGTWHAFGVGSCGGNRAGNSWW